MLFMQIYVDDVTFGAINKSLCEEVSNCMQKEFEMSMICELNFILGSQPRKISS